ncbi:hypothetical protein RND71_021159 [Anisodus tanguticus]|uniref:Uncharacterized protein n=1 Tax=Anisodus tanguticus TaxID=243964 RepID=A0AAE1VFV6_9SOLA|nr:hypothetical protein RND71_021159 [Anisodus tanguticus]
MNPFLSSFRRGKEKEGLMEGGEGKGLGLPIPIGPHKRTRAVERFHIAETKGQHFYLQTSNSSNPCSLPDSGLYSRHAMNDVNTTKGEKEANVKLQRRQESFNNDDDEARLKRALTGIGGPNPLAHLGSGGTLEQCMGCDICGSGGRTRKAGQAGQGPAGTPPTS